jgi:hypothetical protein
MTARKRKATREPLLNTVARKLGHAAGTLTKATQELTESLAAFPETVSTSVREAASAAAPAKRSRVGSVRTHRRKSGAAVNKKRRFAGRQAISAQGSSIEQAPFLMSGFHESARLFPANPTPACSNR